MIFIILLRYLKKKKNCEGCLWCGVIFKIFIIRDSPVQHKISILLWYLIKEIEKISRFRASQGGIRTWGPGMCACEGHAWPYNPATEPVKFFYLPSQKGCLLKPYLQSISTPGISRGRSGFPPWLLDGFPRISSPIESLSNINNLRWKVVL